MVLHRNFKNILFELVLHLNDVVANPEVVIVLCMLIFFQWSFA